MDEAPAEWGTEPVPEASQRCVGGIEEACAVLLHVAAIASADSGTAMQTRAELLSDQLAARLQCGWPDHVGLPSGYRVVLAVLQWFFVDLERCCECRQRWSEAGSRELEENLE